MGTQALAAVFLVHPKLTTVIRNLTELIPFQPSSNHSSSGASQTTLPLIHMSCRVTRRGVLPKNRMMRETHCLLLPNLKPGLHTSGIIEAFYHYHQHHHRQHYQYQRHHYHHHHHHHHHQHYKTQIE